MISEMELKCLKNAEYEYDVIVIGGGPAGFSAGFAAARSGLKTLIVEQFNSLGGIAGAGGHGHICLYSSFGWDNQPRVVGGIIWEVAKRLQASGEGSIRERGSIDFEVEALKRILDEMALESECEILYYTQFSDAVVENGLIQGVVLQNKSGRTLYKAKLYIDASGDGDLAAAAGASFDYGSEKGVCQPMTLMFTIGGVDWKRVCEFTRNKSYGLEEVWEKAQADGFMRPFQKKIMGWWHTPTRPDQLGINFTHINRVSAIDAKDLTFATMEGRRQAYETIAVYRKYIPGMERCHMISTPAMIGTRESRRIHCLHTLTLDDLKSQRKFDDSIGYGSFFVDIHGTEGPGMDHKTWYPESGFKYQIPYRIILPREVHNLYVAGRCAGATHEALGSLRVMPQCGIMGEAAGVGSALAIQKGVLPAAVNPGELQKELKKRNCVIDENDIALHNK